MAAVDAGFSAQGAGYAAEESEGDRGGATAGRGRTGGLPGGLTSPSSAVITDNVQLDS